MQSKSPAALLAFIIVFSAIPVSMYASGNQFQWSPYLIGFTALLFLAVTMRPFLQVLVAVACSIMLTVEVANIQLLKRPVFYDQILAFIDSPLISIQTVTPYATNLLLILPVVGLFSLFYFSFINVFEYIASRQPSLQPKQKLMAGMMSVVALTVASTATSMDYTYSSFPLFKIPMALKYQDSHIAVSRPIPPAPALETTKELPSILWIIGEGADKREMSLYQPQLDTTPELERLLSERDGMIFDNVVAPGKFTAMSHYMMLNYSDPDTFGKNTPSLFGYMKSAGYQTGYFSSRSLTWGHLKSAVASGVDKHIDGKSVNPDLDLLAGIDDQVFIDDVLLPELQALSSGTEPFFIAWQMNGSHAPYADKSPSVFKKYDDEYKNSILYSDSNLARLIDQLPRNIWIFFASDHGKDSMFAAGAESSQVPMFVIPPDEIDGSTHRTLQFNQHQPVSSLDISHTIARLAGHTKEQMTNLKHPYFSLDKDHIPDNRTRFTCGWGSAVLSVISQSSCSEI